MKFLVLWSLLLFSMCASNVIKEKDLYIYPIGRTYSSYAEIYQIGDTLCVSNIMSTPVGKIDSMSAKIKFDPEYLRPIVNDTLEYVAMGNFPEFPKIESWLIYDAEYSIINVVCNSNNLSLGIGRSYSVCFEVLKFGTTKIYFE